MVRVDDLLGFWEWEYEGNLQEYARKANEHNAKFIIAGRLTDETNNS